MFRSFVFGPTFISIVHDNSIAYWNISDFVASRFKKNLIFSSSNEWVKKSLSSARLCLSICKIQFELSLFSFLWWKILKIHWTLNIFTLRSRKSTFVVLSLEWRQTLFKYFRILSKNFRKSLLNGIRFGQQQWLHRQQEQQQLSFKDQHKRIPETKVF